MRPDYKQASKRVLEAVPVLKTKIVHKFLCKSNAYVLKNQFLRDVQQFNFVGIWHLPPYQTEQFQG